MTKKKNIHVVAAVIKYNDKFLCVQRGKSKFAYIDQKYEFPGGKIELGETPEQALIREIKEELKMLIKPIKLLTIVNHEYPDFIINMQGILCHVDNDTLTLTEHIHHLWLPREDLASLDWAAADIPIVELLTDIQNDEN